MKKFLFVLMFVVGFALVVRAVSINSARPILTPEKWYVDVINNSGGDLVNGDVVAWDYTYLSTGAAVTTTTTIGAGNVAGVWEVLSGTKTADGAQGKVQVYGYNSAIKVKSTSIAAYDLLGTTTTAKFAGEFAVIEDTTTWGAAFQKSAFGFAFESSNYANSVTTGTIKGFIKCLGTK